MISRNAGQTRLKMKFIIILCGLVSIQAGVIKEDNCSGVIIEGVYYEKENETLREGNDRLYYANETLREDIDRPYLLVVDNSTNNLYFSYNIKENDDEFKSARLNLNTKEFNNIEGVTNGFAQTVDQATHEIYIGGSDGIYKYDYGQNKAELIGERGSNIWTLYFKDVLYYSLFPHQFLYVMEDGQSKRFVDLEDTKVDHFIIDNEDDIFFSNYTGLFSQKKGTKNAVLYAESPVLRSLATDKFGNAYACLQDGIYAVEKTTTSLKKVVEVNDAFGLAFDNDNNIVYSDASRIIRLKIYKDKTC
ncbi:hypothetical protein PYW07_008419 [Mythimna separata]|uniref:Ommochrome-binding protein n=1 Tax=Mythimna separata TaxID=271217 RepID=A0AAD7YDE5_MYTSE|nr:hypothetical protein PYW07_008419 [Mythimna separata]